MFRQSQPLREINLQVYSEIDKINISGNVGIRSKTRNDRRLNLSLKRYDNAGAARRVDLRIFPDSSSTLFDLLLEVIPERWRKGVERRCASSCLLGNFMPLQYLLCGLCFGTRSRMVAKSLENEPSVSNDS